MTKNTLNEEDILWIKRLLETPRKIAIIAHYNPDGDAIGASLALMMFLQQNNHEVCVLTPNSYPDFLKWMPQSQTILQATENQSLCMDKIATAEIVFCLDFNTFNRTGILQKASEEAKCIKILIDHHIDPDATFDIVYSATEETSSTCELIYNFITNMMNGSRYMNAEIAACLYVGIITDTGSLSYSCNNKSTYYVLGNLLQYGIDGEDIHRKIYDTYSENRIRLLGHCLVKRLVVLEDYASSFIYLTKEDLTQYDYKQGDIEGIVNYGLSMKHVRFTALFSERDDRVRISFRSKGDFNVNDFARNHFQGGGHKNASGGNSYTSMDATIETFKQLLKQYQTALTTPWE
ncbi:MAG: DHH family phosphoesterase [Bacteroidales bacterium]|jgi:phosphoesterase RecJ-like protein|nr:DHH family phosphoesterase [Bacteroidales bacterium]